MACGSNRRGARVSVPERFRSEWLAEVHRQLLVAHPFPPERERERASLVGRRFGDRRTSLASPCLGRFDKAGADALPAERRRDGEVLDPQTRRSQLWRDFPFRCGLWRQQPSDERADDLTFSHGDQVQRGALDRRSLGHERLREALEHLKIVRSEIEVVASDLGMDPRERLLIAPPGLSHGNRLHDAKPKGLPSRLLE
jgi:hypothetical protein